MYDEKIKLYSPEIDQIGNVGMNSFGYDNHSYKSKNVANLLQSYYHLIQQIKPKENGQDKIWSLWLQSERGEISAYVNEEECNELIEAGEIQNREELEAIWKNDYPEEVKWHKVSFILYEREFFISFDLKFQVKINLDSYEITGANLKDEEQIQLLSWLKTEIEHVVNTFKKDPNLYNRFISEKLPLNKRFGKIKRIILWEKVKNYRRLDEEFGQLNIRKFENIVNTINEQEFIKEMTADKYFRYCEICYNANKYFKNSEKISPRDKYRRMADGRDEGLLEIKGDSQKVFAEWYKNRFHGGHPWEICRGGNTTHISFILHRDKVGWKLYLNGSSRVRAVETAKMAIALFEHKIPFILMDAEQIVNMLKGNDYLGIVPEDVTPKYCHSYFPDEDKIHDFINPWYDEEVVKAIEKYARWYPVETLEINN